MDYYKDSFLHSFRARGMQLARAAKPDSGREVAGRRAGLLRRGFNNWACLKVQRDDPLRDASEL